MRCPKCHYISFEAADRCRNCGYDFSLADATAEPATELPLRERDENPLPPIDLSLSQVDGLRELPRSDPHPTFDIDQIEGGKPATPIDLPLFKSAPNESRDPRPSRGHRLDRQEQDAPLVRPSAVPRAPVAVRRPTPDVQRLRSRYGPTEAPRLNLEPAPSAGAAAVRAKKAPVPVADVTTGEFPAPAGRRLIAGFIDATIIAAMNAAVLYFTLKVCALPLALEGLGALPAAPLAGFLLLLNAGYFVTFTAAVGQTIGKMATGLKIVPASAGGIEANGPNFSFAILRTAAYAASILPIGLGFLPALFAKDRRALHDRLADTRVISTARS